ncbi:MAG: alkaline phosphatase [Hyphomonadaceae bacterium]
MRSKKNQGVTRRGALTALGLSTAAAACGQRPPAPRYLGALAFNHGVASGDPRTDRVIIWTRVTPEQEGPVPVRWIVARNRALTSVVQTGVAETDARRNYTVKVDVAGLRPGAPYFYGFLAGDQQSAVGKTRTLRDGRLDSIKIAVASCASYSHGFFNVYDAISKEEELDLVIHLGDYIYEYGLGGFGGDEAVELGRIPSPEIECLSLDDYRLRHAQYKAERELQDAHAAAPWIVVWDDHEVANDSWMGGAENHNASEREGAWADRKRAALQAYYEWMPIRDPEAGGAFESINRSFQFGDLMTLVMLETRLLGRTQPFNYATELPVYLTPWDFTNPEAPRPISPSAPRGPNVRVLPVPYEEVGGRLRSVWDWPRVQAAISNPEGPPAGLQFIVDRARLNQALNAPERRMLGQQQEQWLAQQLSASAAARTPWQVIGNQVLMAQVLAPDLHAAPARAMNAAEAAAPGSRRLMQFTRLPFPLSTDAWDGYPQNRARVLDMFRRTQGNVLVLTGDSHAAWANNLNVGEERVAIELGATSVTSPSPGDLFAQAGVDFAAGIRARNPNVVFNDQTKRGYLRLTLNRTRALAEFMAVSTVASPDYRVSVDRAFTIRAEQGPGLGELTPVEQNEREKGR